MTVHRSQPGWRDDGSTEGWVPDTDRYIADSEDSAPERCPVCHAVTDLGARYCDACGSTLFHTPPAEGDDDHRELDFGPIAGVCDRGIRHATNEDAMGLAIVANTLIAVVCDGVSTTPGSDRASRAAAAKAVEVIADAVRGQGPGPGPGQPSRSSRRDGHQSSDDVLDVLQPTQPPRYRYSERGGHPGRDELDAHTTAPRPMRGDGQGFHGFDPAQAEEAIHAAAVAAQAAIMEECGGGRSVPSCTFAAAVVTTHATGDTTLTAGWIGDSRIYLFGPRWCERVSEDDTWAAEAARAGIIPASEAETHRRAHTLTRWLGGDAGDIAPHTRVHRVDPPSTVIVCSDGLWNYASRPDALATVAAGVPEGTSALGVARHLTAFALDRGGHDNITVVAAQVGDFRANGGKLRASGGNR